MTLFGYCPSCGYPWYCMCRTCEPDAPEYAKDWEHSDLVQDGMKCPNCGEVANYDTLAWICEEVEKVFINAMRTACEKCISLELPEGVRNCGKCPLVPFTRTAAWYGEELTHARLADAVKTCRTCDSALCKFIQDDSELDKPQDCDHWQPINYHKYRKAAFKREDYIAKGEWKE